MRPRTPTPGLQHHVSRLWESRLATTTAPNIPADMPVPHAAEASDWPPEPLNPLESAARTAVNLHGILEMPQNGPRQSRATLATLAMLALRKAP